MGILPMKNSVHHGLEGCATVSNGLSASSAVGVEQAVSTRSIYGQDAHATWLETRHH
jgi:hypothetical protein